MLKTRAGIGAVTALLAAGGHVGVVVDLPERNVLAGERALGRRAPRAADHLKIARRAVQTVIVLLAADDREDIDEVTPLPARHIDHDHRAAVDRALRIGPFRLDFDDA